MGYGRAGGQGGGRSRRNYGTWGPYGGWPAGGYGAYPPPYGPPPGPYAGYGYSPYMPPPPPPEQELEMLREQAEYLEGMLGDIRKRIEELEAEVQQEG